MYLRRHQKKSGQTMMICGLATICKPVDEPFAIGYVSTENDLYRLQFIETFGPKIHECIKSPSRFWNCTVKTNRGLKVGEILDIQQPRSDGDVFELDSQWDGDVVGKREGEYLKFTVDTVQVGTDAVKVVQKMFSKLACFDTIVVNGELVIELEH
jgi:hypothetical protein